jgi:hypothetical protein
VQEASESSAGVVRSPLLPAAELADVIGLAAGAAGPERLEALQAFLGFLQQRKLGAGSAGEGGIGDSQEQTGEGMAQQQRQRGNGGGGGKGRAVAVDLELGLIKDSIHLGPLLRRSLRLEQGQGLGEIGGPEHGAAELLQGGVELGGAGGCCGGLAQGGELLLGAGDALQLGAARGLLLTQASRELQGEEQQEADGGGHGELGEEAAALLEQRIDRIELAGDQEQGQSQQGKGGAGDQGLAEPLLPGWIEGVKRQQRPNELEREEEQNKGPDPAECSAEPGQGGRRVDLR